ncbi:unnamed protein product [Amaranthus hypochondriacus]
MQYNNPGGQGQQQYPQYHVPNQGSGLFGSFGGNLNGSSLIKTGHFKFGNSSTNGGDINLSNHGTQNGQHQISGGINSGNIVN